MNSAIRGRCCSFRTKRGFKLLILIEDPKVIKQILEHLGLSSTAPRLMQARGPPLSDQSDFFAQEFFEH